jgi:ribosomal protein S18 acetylase RimI-like enzyme
MPERFRRTITGWPAPKAAALYGAAGRPPPASRLPRPPDEGRSLVEAAPRPSGTLSQRAPRLTRKAGDQVFVADDDNGRSVGYLIARFSAWNRRGEIWDIAVREGVRRRGVGRALIEHAEKWAVTSGARGLWLETQTTNHPAVQFYRSLGFQLCGLDISLYDAASQEEVAVFLWKSVEPPG